MINHAFLLSNPLLIKIMMYVSKGPGNKCNLHFDFSHDEKITRMGKPPPLKLFYTLSNINLFYMDENWTHELDKSEVASLIQDIDACLSSKYSIFNQILYAGQPTLKLVRTYDLFEFFDLLSQLTYLTKDEINDIYKIKKENFLLNLAVPKDSSKMNASSPSIKV